jgi:hypothetical protein
MYFIAAFFPLIPQVHCLLKKIISEFLFFMLLYMNFSFYIFPQETESSPRSVILNKKLHFIYINIYIILKN